MLTDVIHDPITQSPDGLFLSLTSQYAQVLDNLLPIVEALRVPGENNESNNVGNAIRDISENVYSELLKLSGGLYDSRVVWETKRDFIHKTWESYMSILGRLLYMNGARGPEIDRIISTEDFTTDMGEIGRLNEYKHSFPNAFHSHQILSLAQGVKEIFYQWYAGADEQKMAKMLEEYYHTFQFDEQTTATYTNQRELISVSGKILESVLRQEPLRSDARIAILGPGLRPTELEVIRALKEKGILTYSVIEGFDLQTAEQLGITGDQIKQWQVNDAYKFHGGQPVNEVGGKFDVVFCFGSVFYNDLNNFHHFQNLFRTTQLLKPGGLLVYDAASFESSPAHIKAYQKLQNLDPTTTLGLRQSAHFEQFLARILPHHLLETYTQLGGVNIIAESVWKMTGGKSRTFIVGQKNQSVEVISHLIESLISRAYETPAPLRRPSPVS